MDGKLDGNNNEGGKIRDFYRGKSILITGSTGFLGKVLLHKLLRECHHIQKIYLLIRPKKGIAPKDRLDAMLDVEIFQDWKKNQPDRFAKLVPINGDISEPNMGLSEEDHNTLTENVSIVYHSAASVRFNEPIEIALKMNLHGTAAMLELARKMSKLEVFVHVSTAYSHCYMNTSIEERFYVGNLHTQQSFWDIVLSDDGRKMEIDDLQKYCNTYTCAKNITESYISRYCQDLPVVIVRPSIVCASWKEPIPGWVDNQSALTGMIAAVQAGLLRSMLVSRDKVIDLVPVDVVINTMIVAAWKRGTVGCKPRISPIPIRIYHVTSGNTNPITWRQIEQWMFASIIKYPLDYKTNVWYPGGSFKSNATYDLICRVMFQYVPAYLLDFVLYILRIKPFLVKISNKIRNSSDVFMHFANKQYEFGNRNLLKLRLDLEQTDEASLQAFDFDLSSFDWKSYFDDYAWGTRHFVLKNKPESLEVSRKIMNLKKLVHYSIPLFFGLGMLYMINLWTGFLPLAVLFP